MTHTAKVVVIKGVGKLTAIEPVIIKVALCHEDRTVSFRFSRTRLVLRLVLLLSSGCNALCNILLLVADDDVASGDLLIVFHVLQHLGPD